MQQAFLPKRHHLLGGLFSLEGSAFFSHALDTKRPLMHTVKRLLLLALFVIHVVVLVAGTTPLHTPATAVLDPFSHYTQTLKNQ